MKTLTTLAGAALVAAFTATIGMYQAAPEPVSDTGAVLAATSAPERYLWQRALSVEGDYGTTYSMGKLPAGRYQATLDAWITGPAHSRFACEVYDADDRPLVTDVESGDAYAVYDLHATRTFRLTEPSRLRLACNGVQQENWASRSGLPIQVMVTRLGPVEARTLTPLVT